MKPKPGLEALGDAAREITAEALAVYNAIQTSGAYAPTGWNAALLAASVVVAKELRFAVGGNLDNLTTLLQHRLDDIDASIRSRK